MVSTLLRDPQALSSTLASLGMLQPRAFGSLKMRRDLGPWIYKGSMKIYKGSMSLFRNLVWTNEITVFVTTRI